MSEDFDLGWLVEGEHEDGAQRAAAVDRKIRFFETRLRELLAGDETNGATGPTSETA